jgi:hypothetical protein
MANTDKPKFPTYNPSGIPDTRIRHIFNSFMNGEVDARTSKIREQLRPFNAARKALEDKQEPQNNPDGTPMYDAEKKRVFKALTAARKAELEKQIKDNSDTINKLEAECTVCCFCSFLQGGGSLSARRGCYYVNGASQPCAQHMQPR